jgi:hypothetical protein
MILALFISVKYYKVSDDFDNYIEVSELENRILDSQLTEILHKYDSISAKSKIDSLRFHEKMSLMQSGKTLSNKPKFNSAEDSIVFYAKKQQANAGVLNNKSSVAADAKLLPKTDKLSALNINAKGVKIYSDNYSLKDSKIQQLRVCFTLEENQLVKSGEKTIYVQIVNPKNQIISAGNTSVESDLNVKLQYSASVETNYKKEDTDVCTYVNLEQKKTIKGKYKINIYHDFVKIGTAVFEY